MLYRSDVPEAGHGIDAIRKSLPPEWRLEAVAVNEHPFVAAAIDALTQKSVDAIWTTADQRIYDTASVRALLLAGIRAKIPVWGYSFPFVRAGALLGVGVEPRGQGVQAAEIVVKALAGKAAPGGQGPAAAGVSNRRQSHCGKATWGRNSQRLDCRATNVFRAEN